MDAKFGKELPAFHVSQADWMTKVAQSIMAGSYIVDLLIILIGGNRLLRVVVPQVADAAPDAPAH